MSNIYTDDSIETLDARSHIRLRSGMYAGDTSTPNQLLLEAFSNALDEFNIGHGNKINVSIFKDGTCVVEDEAQGFPINSVREEDDKTVLEASFSVINTSAKYSDDGVYEGSSLGLNGIGLKLVTFLSEYLEVITHKDGMYEKIRFEEGLFVDREVGKVKDKTSSGTKITYKPDAQFFDSAFTQVNHFKKFFSDICCLCDGLTVNLTTDDGTESITKNGINDFVGSRVKDNIEIISNRFIFENDNIKLGMTFTANSNAEIIPYVNYGLTDTGPHITLIKSTITRVFNAWAREKSLIKDKEKNLDGTSIQEGMLLVCNLISKGVSYEAQTKLKINKLDTSPLDDFAKQLEIWLDNNPADGTNIIEKALLARKAADAAKKARDAVKAGKKKKNTKVKIMNPDKLKDAEFLGDDATLLVVEGLSAGASMCVARDHEKYGILMLRGKLINALTKSDEQLMKNEEIQLLFKALGIEPYHYDASDLRYGSLAICVDADSDGEHISLLILSALQRFCPEFITEGRAKWLRSPLYIVKNKDKSEDYYFTDAELNAAKQKDLVHGEVQRNKGLGSISADQAKASMFGDAQIMETIIPTEDGIKLLIDLMGENVAPRKEFIFNEIDFSEVRE